jgi:hypothetical protein
MISENIAAIISEIIGAMFSEIIQKEKTNNLNVPFLHPSNKTKHLSL